MKTVFSPQYIHRSNYCSIIVQSTKHVLYYNPFILELLLSIFLSSEGTGDEKDGGGAETQGTCTADERNPPASAEARSRPSECRPMFTATPRMRLAPTIGIASETASAETAPTEKISVYAHLILGLLTDNFASVSRKPL